ncbi:hypothetical protein HA402_008581 [Bradysia odoriphaga]|nr:hypothetical protein HA402_008581 [Bradysia odoriphaga]
MPKPVTYSDGSTPRICIIGAGFSGLCAAIKLKTELGLKTFIIYEGNDDVGGTWYSNTYPGCACDVPSHLYSFSFELNPDWSKNFSPQPEILDYLRKVARKYELYSKIKFQTHVKSTRWDESIRKWKVVLQNKLTNQEEEQIFDIVVSGPGALRLPNIPNQFKSFQGPWCHSAEWDNSIDLNNKVVGIVGSGTSAVQIIPSIVPKVKELHVFQRRSAWVLPRQQFEFPTFVKTLFSFIPFFMTLYRTFLYLSLEFRYYAFKANSYFGKAASKASMKFLKAQIPDDSNLRQTLTPKFKFGCKRMLLTNDYYPALNMPKTTIHTSTITQVGGNSFTMENGVTQKLDVLILATGFLVQDFFAPLQIIGKDSANILQKWKQSQPRLYYGIVSSEMPNHFTLLGPNTALGHNTVVFMIECQVDFMINLIREMINRDSKFVAVKEHVEEKYMASMKTKMRETVWGTEKCGSWYANNAGIITALWPKNCTSYWRETKAIDFEKFKFE